MNFKNISLEDKSLIDDYTTRINSKSYEYSFASLYLWRDLCNTKLCIFDDCLIVKKEMGDKTFFMMPYGYKKEGLTKIVSTLKGISNGNSTYLFGEIDDNFVADLLNFTDYNYSIYEDRNSYEYIYYTQDLINLAGKKYHQKKNHYNSFVNSYNYSVTTINSSEVIADCLDLLDNWHKNNPMNCTELQIESKEISDLLINLNYLKLKSIAVYVGHELAGFAVGEIYGDTAIIHVERCNIYYKGIYSFINREFLKRDFSSTIYVNRQEDCGCAGLRKSKLSYYPVFLLKKSLIVL